MAGIGYTDFPQGTLLDFVKRFADSSKLQLMVSQPSDKKILAALFESNPEFFYKGHGSVKVIAEALQAGDDIPYGLEVKFSTRGKEWVRSQRRDLNVAKSFAADAVQKEIDAGDLTGKQRAEALQRVEDLTPDYDTQYDLQQRTKTDRILNRPQGGPQGPIEPNGPLGPVEPDALTPAQERMRRLGIEPQIMGTGDFEGDSYTGRRIGSDDPQTQKYGSPEDFRADFESKITSPEDRALVDRTAERVGGPTDPINRPPKTVEQIYADFDDGLINERQRNIELTDYARRQDALTRGELRSVEGWTTPDDMRPDPEMRNSPEVFQDIEMKRGRLGNLGPEDILPGDSLPEGPRLLDLFDKQVVTTPRDPRSIPVRDIPTMSAADQAQMESRIRNVQTFRRSNPWLKQFSASQQQRIMRDLLDPETGLIKPSDLDELFATKLPKTVVPTRKGGKSGGIIEVGNVADPADFGGLGKVAGNPLIDNPSEVPRITPPNVQQIENIMPEYPSSSPLPDPIAEQLAQGEVIRPSGSSYRRPTMASAKAMGTVDIGEMVQVTGGTPGNIGKFGILEEVAGGKGRIRIMEANELGQLVETGETLVRDAKSIAAVYPPNVLNNIPSAIGTPFAPKLGAIEPVQPVAPNPVAAAFETPVPGGPLGPIETVAPTVVPDVPVVTPVAPVTPTVAPVASATPIPLTGAGTFPIQTPMVEPGMVVGPRPPLTNLGPGFGGTYLPPGSTPLPAAAVPTPAIPTTPVPGPVTPVTPVSPLTPGVITPPTPSIPTPAVPAPVAPTGPLAALKAGRIYGTGSKFLKGAFMSPVGAAGMIGGAAANFLGGRLDTPDKVDTRGFQADVDTGQFLKGAGSTASWAVPLAAGLAALAPATGGLSLIPAGLAAAATAATVGMGVKNAAFNNKVTPEAKLQRIYNATRGTKLGVSSSDLADAKAMYRSYVEQGMSPEEAQQAASSYMSQLSQENLTRSSSGTRGIPVKELLDLQRGFQQQAADSAARQNQYLDAALAMNQNVIGDAGPYSGLLRAQAMNTRAQVQSSLETMRQAAQVAPYYKAAYQLEQNANKTMPLTDTTLSGLYNAAQGTGMGG